MPPRQCWSEGGQADRSRRELLLLPGDAIVTMAAPESEQKLKTTKSAPLCWDVSYHRQTGRTAEGRQTHGQSQKVRAHMGCVAGVSKSLGEEDESRDCIGVGDGPAMP